MIYLLFEYKDSWDDKSESEWERENYIIKSTNFFFFIRLLRQQRPFETKRKKDDDEELILLSLLLRWALKLYQICKKLILWLNNRSIYLSKMIINQIVIEYHMRISRVRYIFSLLMRNDSIICFSWPADMRISRTDIVEGGDW